MKEIKKIKNLSLAKVTAAIYGFMGFLTAIVIAILTMANIIIKEDFSGSVLLIALFNLGMGILIGLVTAVAMAVAGWIIGFLTAAFYNFFAKHLGGLEFELEEKTLRQAARGEIQGKEDKPQTQS
ncbi:MAG: hypothetical protein PHR36_05370 [Patescibacteria group bacterium]|nr:hypothetical protein [Patescibacteria group bacterium]